MSRTPLSRALAAPSLAAFACALSPLLSSPLVAQDPLLWLGAHAIPAQPSQQTIYWTLLGRAGDVYALLADVQPGVTDLLGSQFDLGFTPNLLALSIGFVVANGTQGQLQFNPAALPLGMPIYCQVGEFDFNQGFASMLVSNVDSFATHPGSYAIVASFDYPAYIQGVFDKTVNGRLQALPAVRRTTRPMPPLAFPQLLQTPFGMLHASGSRVQMALRAADLAANGVPEQLVAARWRPLFGVIAPETFPQFELLAAHTDVTPDYTVDDFSALPAFPLSGLSTTFAQNAATTPVTLSSGLYDVRPQDLLPSGYLPFPAVQQPFDYDGERTLLLETRCSPTPSLGPVQNHCLLSLMVLSSAQPFGTVYASAGWNGQQSPLQPLAATTGTGGSFLFDLELEFVRTRSVATSSWNYSGPTPDYLTPIIASYSPVGTSITIEYRGQDLLGITSPWSNTPDIADGMELLQFRVTMESDLATGTVPWLDTLIVPVQ